MDLSLRKSINCGAHTAFHGRFKSVGTIKQSHEIGLIYLNVLGNWVT